MKKAFLLIVLFVCFQSAFAQINTYRAPKAFVLPVFDGDSIDNIWNFAQWKDIDQPWIPYNNILPSAFATESGTKTITGATDFSGRYKMLWSEADSLVLFLVEIHDDIFIDGYVPNASTYPNYDVIEIFIDEDHSGGNHLFDSGGNNAENAFAYHMNVNAPPVGGITTSLTGAMDIYGNSYSNIINYKSHFPKYSMKNYGGGRYVYEFAMRIYKDTYDNSNPFASRRGLSLNDNMGLSIAYCDNDENDGMRNHFIGSVTLSGANNNNSYVDASIFGTLILTNSDTIAPSVPFNLIITNNVLSWSLSTDNGSVGGYNLYQNNVFLTSLTGLTYTLPGYTPPGSPYPYKVQAFDASGNVSDFSDFIIYTPVKPQLTALVDNMNEGCWSGYGLTVSGIHLLDSVYIKNEIDCFSLNNRDVDFYKGIYKLAPINSVVDPVAFDVVECLSSGRAEETCIAIYYYVNEYIYIYSKYADTIKLCRKVQKYTCSVTGISQEIVEDPIFYPNPANEVLNIHLKKSVSITITNVLGNTVFAKSLPEGHQIIDISNLKKGYYLINIQQSNQPKLVKPIIKE